MLIFVLGCISLQLAFIGFYLCKILKHLEYNNDISFLLFKILKHLENKDKNDDEGDGAHEE